MSGDNVVIVAGKYLRPIGNHNSTEDLGSATTISVPSGASKAMIQAVDQNIRYTLDGSTPTATHGFQLAASNEPVLIPVGDGITLKMLEEAGAAELQIQWFE